GAVTAAGAGIEPAVRGSYVDLARAVDRHHQRDPTPVRGRDHRFDHHVSRALPRLSQAAVEHLAVVTRRLQHDEVDFLEAVYRQRLLLPSRLAAPFAPQAEVAPVNAAP